MYSARHRLLDSRQPFFTGVLMRLIWLVLALGLVFAPLAAVFPVGMLLAQFP